MFTMRKMREYVEKFEDELDPVEMAKRELMEAKRRLLETLSALDYAKATVSYHQARIDRLTTYLQVQQHIESQQKVDNQPKL
jgi:hypothetical protein